MESLVEKWKTTINSKNFSNSFRESQNMAKNNSLQSSNEKPPIKPSVGLPSSIRKNLRAVSSTSSDDDLSLELFRQPAEKKKQPKLNSAKKTKVLNENTPVKSITKDFIKENVYLVLDLFEKEIPLKGFRIIYQNLFIFILCLFLRENYKH